MKTRVMITGAKTTEYLAAALRDLEAVLTPEERAKASVKGFDVLGVEGGSDTIYHYRIAATLAPADLDKWAFRAVEFDCTGATGRTWGNGQKGPMEADVTFTAVAVTPIDLSVIQADAERRAEQAKTETDAYKAQRQALTALEAAVRERLAKAQTGEPTAKAGK
jgi:hypothetical protein